VTGNKFPASFGSTVRKMLRLELHVLSHVYRSHWHQLVELELHPHFNTLVLHVMLFARQFDLLVDATRDADVLRELFDRLRRHSLQAPGAAAVPQPPSSTADTPAPPVSVVERSVTGVDDSPAPPQAPPPSS